jgi:predicted esterase
MASLGADPKSQDKAGTQAAVEYVSSLIQQEVAAGIPLDRIVVAGFSQARTSPNPD